MGVSMNNVFVAELIEELGLFTKCEKKDPLDVQVALRTANGVESHFYLDIEGDKLLITPESFYRPKGKDQKGSEEVNQFYLEASGNANKPTSLRNSLAMACRDVMTNMDSHFNWPTNVSFRWRQLVIGGTPDQPLTAALALVTANGEELNRCFTVTCNNMDSPGRSTEFKAKGYLMGARELEMAYARGNTGGVKLWAVRTFKDPYTLMKGLLHDLSEIAAIPLKYPDIHTPMEGFW